MYLPTIQGIIDRRILVNYHVDPTLVEDMLPSPFRPHLVRGKAIVGFCLIRLTHLRPRGMPAVLGLSSENAAHRIAVEWEENGKHRTGVYIPMRHSSSHVNVLAGDRLFPGLQSYADFKVMESNETFHIEVESPNHETRLVVEAQLASSLAPTSLFTSLQEASAYFEQGSVGYSVTKRLNALDGLELHSRNWQIEPLQVTKVESSFFDDRSRFPQGSVELDCALLMRAIEHEWHVRESLCSCSRA